MFVHNMSIYNVYIYICKYIQKKKKIPNLSISQGKIIQSSRTVEPSTLNSASSSLHWYELKTGVLVFHIQG